MTRTVIDFDHNLDLKDLAKSIRKQTNLASFFGDMSPKTFLAYASLCDAYMGEGIGEEPILPYIQFHGIKSTKSYAMLLAASFCWLPNEINQAIWDHFGIVPTSRS